jgi:hypothetical protein
VKTEKTLAEILVLIVILATLAQMQSLTLFVQALEPSESHAASAMWIEPSMVELDPALISIGYKFNVTAWANSSLECKGWQFWMYYVNDYINATRVGYTAGDKSEFLQDLITLGIAPSFKVDFNATHNRLDFGEAWLMGDFRQPGYGSLCWIEFEVINLPPGSTAVDILLNINEAYALTGPPQTYLLYGDGSKRPLNVYNGLVQFIGAEPDNSPPLITVLSPTNDTYITTSIQLSFTVNETTSWIGYSLDGGANVTIAGDTMLLGVPYGSHHIVVYANDTSGNMGASQTVYFTNIVPTTKSTDLNSDGFTGIDDIVMAGEYFGSYPGHPRWDPKADIDNDGIVTIMDIVLVALDFGTAWP